MSHRHPYPDRIKCRICGGWYEALTPSHLAKHGLIPSAYKRRCHPVRRDSAPRVATSAPSARR